MRKARESHESMVKKVFSFDIGDTNGLTYHESSSKQLNLMYFLQQAICVSNHKISAKISHTKFAFNISSCKTALQEREHNGELTIMHRMLHLFNFF